MATVEQIIASVLGISAKDIDDETTPDAIEQWDSFNGLLLVAELEKKFGVEFSVEEVASVKTVGDIKKLLQKHGVPDVT